MAQQVKDPALSLQQLGFNPWPGNLHMLWVCQKKKKVQGVNGFGIMSKDSFKETRQTKMNARASARKAEVLIRSLTK